MAYNMKFLALICLAIFTVSGVAYAYSVWSNIVSASTEAFIVLSIVQVGNDVTLTATVTFQDSVNPVTVGSVTFYVADSQGNTISTITTVTVNGQGVASTQYLIPFPGDTYFIASYVN